MSGRPRVAVLTSHRAPGLAELLAPGAMARAPFRIAGVVASSADCTAHEVVQRAGIAWRARDVRGFFAAAAAPRTDPAVRARYDEGLRDILLGWRADLVLCCGYLRLLGAPVLDAFPGRVLNVHDADLALRDASGGPRYPGLHATRDAIIAGEPVTRSSVHVVTPELDAGPVVARSRPFAVAPLVRDARAMEATDVLRAYAYAHREWMMRSCWAELITEALTMIADGGGPAAATGPRDASEALALAGA